MQCERALKIARKGEKKLQSIFLFLFNIFKNANTNTAN